jgi:hypothetical protein
MALLGLPGSSRDLLLSRTFSAHPLGELGMPDHELANHARLLHRLGTRGLTPELVTDSKQIRLPPTTAITTRSFPFKAYRSTTP